MNEMNEIKLPEGVDRIAVTQHDDKIVIEFIPKEPKFKRGDILKSTGTPDLTVIFDKVTSTTTFDSIYHNMEASNHGVISNHDWSLGIFRHATKEEKQEFFNELKAEGKRWNAEKLIVEDIPKFKEGDFVYEDGRIMIVKNYPDSYYALMYPKLSMKSFYNGRYAPTMTLSSLSFRCATEDEKQLLIDAMEKDGKRWNAEAMEIEDILKKGDFAIFWDNAYRNPLIRLYHRKTDSGRRHFDNFGIPWDNAVKWDGTKEQFEKVLRGEI